MEKDRCIQCFDFIIQAGLKIQIFISDRHKIISKWVMEYQKATLHLLDILHVCKSLQRDIVKASKAKGCEILKDWNKAI